MDWHDLDERIADLSNLALEAESGRINWKDIWDRIKGIGGDFKSVRYPAGSERDAAWRRFQGIVDDVKRMQANWRSRREAVSTTHKDRIHWHAGNATIVEGLIGDVLGGVTRDELMHASAEMKEAWSYFSEHKHDLLREDKDEIYERLRGQQESLDGAWARFKEWKQGAQDRHHEERARSHEEWCQRVRARIEKHHERLGRLNGALQGKKAHVATLRERLGQTYNEHKRDEIEGWIEETEDGIEELEEIIAGVEEWLGQDLEKLQRC